MKQFTQGRRQLFCFGGTEKWKGEGRPDPYWKLKRSPENFGVLAAPPSTPLSIHLQQHLSMSPLIQPPQYTIKLVQLHTHQISLAAFGVLYDIFVVTQGSAKP